MLFEHPARAGLAVEYGLELAQKQMAQKPGETMGCLPLGIPFWMAMAERDAVSPYGVVPSSRLFD